MREVVEEEVAFSISSLCIVVGELDRDIIDIIET